MGIEQWCKCVKWAQGTVSTPEVAVCPTRTVFRAVWTNFLPIQEFSQHLWQVTLSFSAFSSKNGPFSLMTAALFSLSSTQPIIHAWALPGQTSYLL